MSGEPPSRPEGPFEKPIKGDIDRVVSEIMHAARHQLLKQRTQRQSEATKTGSLQSNRLIIVVAEDAKALHEAAIVKIQPLLSSLC